MPDLKETIAGLIPYLPLFMRTLLEGSTAKTTPRLNISEERTLLYIFKHEGETMTDYSKRVGLARGSFTTVADSLEEKGLTVRLFDPEDRRKCALSLTKEGKKIAREIDRQFKQHIATVLACLTEEEQCNLQNALETIITITKKLSDRRTR